MQKIYTIFQIARINKIPDREINTHIGSKEKNIEESIIFIKNLCPSVHLKK